MLILQESCKILHEECIRLQDNIARFLQGINFWKFGDAAILSLSACKEKIKDALVWIPWVLNYIQV